MEGFVLPGRSSIGHDKGSQVGQDAHRARALDGPGHLIGVRSMRRKSGKRQYEGGGGSKRVSK